MTNLADLVTVSRRADTITLWLATECKPYVRMTQAGKWTGRAKDYNNFQVAWKERIRLAMGVRGVSPLPGSVPLFFSVNFQYARKAYHSFDLDNLVKSSLDLCQGVVFRGVDSWVDRIVSDRIPGVTGISITCGVL